MRRLSWPIVGPSQRVRSPAARDAGARSGWSVATAAEAQGVSRATGYKWLRRFRAEGPARPRRPELATASLAAARRRPRGRARSSPHALALALGSGSPRPAARPCRARRSAPSCVGRASRAWSTSIDRRACPSALRGLPPGRARPPGPQEARPDPRRWWPPGPRSLDRDAPRAKGGRLRPLRGDRRRPQPARRRRPGPGRERGERGRAPSPSRWPCSQPTGIVVERVMTDNGLGVSLERPTGRSSATVATRAPGPIDRRPTARPSGSSGRSSREWAYARPYRSNAERLAALPALVDFYNHRRPHTALGGLTPIGRCQQPPWGPQLAAPALLRLPRQDPCGRRQELVRQSLVVDGARHRDRSDEGGEHPDRPGPRRRHVGDRGQSRRSSI